MFCDTIFMKDLSKKFLSITAIILSVFFLHSCSSADSSASTSTLSELQVDGARVSVTIDAIASLLRSAFSADIQDSEASETITYNSAVLSCESGQMSITGDMDIDFSGSTFNQANGSFAIEYDWCVLYIESPELSDGTCQYAITLDGLMNIDIETASQDFSQSSTTSQESTSAELSVIYEGISKVVTLELFTDESTSGNITLDGELVDTTSFGPSDISTDEFCWEFMPD